MYGFPCANVDVDNYRHSTLFEKKMFFESCVDLLKQGLFTVSIKDGLRTADYGLRTADWV